VSASGVVYLVGAGPGAPDLLTLRAARLLGEADIVFHDALVHPETVALATRAEKFAVGKRCGKHSTAQRFINKRLVDAAQTHRVVVRLKGGDPLLFGRAQEEIVALEAAGIAYEVVPGITAALACAAAVGTSLSQRGTVRSIALATPRVGDGEGASDWARGFASADAGAIYMGIGDAAGVAAALRSAGKPAALPVAIVERASLPEQRVVYTTLAELPAIDATQFTGPTLLLIGPQFVDRRATAAALNSDAIVTLLRRAHG
jgi:uroporphyrin-III C-methyltransferase